LHRRMSSVEEIRTDREFYHLKGEWNELLSRSESNVVFLTWDWLYNWWECFKNDSELRILLIRDRHNLKCIAPFFVSKTKVRGWRRLNFLGSTSVGSDYLDFILEKGSEDEIISQIFDYLNSNKEKWQAISLTDIPDQSRTIALVYRYYKDNFYVSTKAHTICPYIPLPDNYEVFLNSLSSNMRYNVRRKRRRFENDFHGEFIVLKERSELEKSIDDLIRLNANRMHEKKINSPFYDKSFSEFHRNVMRTFFEKNWLRLFFLRVKGRLVASLYAFAYGGKYYYYQSGFDPEWGKVSPGLLLFSYSIENAILEGANEFDFLQGDEEYKHNWTKQARRNLKITIYRNSAENIAVYLGEKFKLICKAKIKKSLHKLKLLK
jgi:CelD/BcsL family acetyltransferase involved in cellulose biosynthesis